MPPAVLEETQGQSEDSQVTFGTFCCSDTIKGVGLKYVMLGTHAGRFVSVFACVHVCWV